MHPSFLSFSLSTAHKLRSPNREIDPGFHFPPLPLGFMKTQVVAAKTFDRPSSLAN
jgi:hypothetical protein